MPGNSPVRGDIYHFDFERPLGPHYAIVVSSDALNASSVSIVVALITSAHMDNIWPHQFPVPKGLLKKPSKVKCDALIMLPREDCTADNWKTTVNNRDMDGLNVSLMKALDLWY